MRATYHVDRSGVVIVYRLGTRVFHVFVPAVEA
jgi:hypothetical protein